MFFEDIFGLSTESRCFCKHSPNPATAPPSVIMPTIWLLGRLPLKNVPKSSNSCYTLADFPSPTPCPKGESKGFAAGSQLGGGLGLPAAERTTAECEGLRNRPILGTPLGRRAYNFIRARLSSYYVLKRQGPPKSPIKT